MIVGTRTVESALVIALLTANASSHLGVRSRVLTPQACPVAWRVCYGSPPEPRSHWWRRRVQHRCRVLADRQHCELSRLSHILLANRIGAAELCAQNTTPPTRYRRYRRHELARSWTQASRNCPIH